MTAPTIDTATVAPTTQAVSERTNAKAADMLTFKIGMSMVAVVLVLMAAVGVVVGSPVMIITAGLVGCAATFMGVYTGINTIAG